MPEDREATERGGDAPLGPVPPQCCGHGRQDDDQERRQRRFREHLEFMEDHPCVGR